MSQININAQLGDPTFGVLSVRSEYQYGPVLVFSQQASLERKDVIMLRDLLSIWLEVNP